MSLSGDVDVAAAIRPQDRSLRVRQRLIAAGLREFAAMGYNSTPLKAIAQRASVSVAVLEFHFPSKEGLWKAAAEKIFGEFHTTFGTVFETTAGLTPRVRAETLVTEAVLFFAQHPEFHRFMTDEVRGPRANWLAEIHLKPLHQIFDSVIADLDEGIGADIPDRSHLFYMFVGAAAAPYGMSVEYNHTNNCSPYDADEVNRHARAMILTFLPPKDRG